LGAKLADDPAPDVGKLEPAYQERLSSGSSSDEVSVSSQGKGDDARRIATKEKRRPIQAGRRSIKKTLRQVRYRRFYSDFDSDAGIKIISILFVSRSGGML